MKNRILVVLMLVGSAFAANAQTVTVKADRALDTDFSDYNTFYWSSQADAWLDEGGLYFFE